MGEIRARGFELVVLSPQAKAYGLALERQHGLSFKILVDTGNRVAESFGLKHRLPADLDALYQRFGADLHRCNADREPTLPLAARYVIDAQGVIRASSVHADYKRRPEPLDLLGALPSA